MQFKTKVPDIQPDGSYCFDEIEWDIEIPWRVRKQMIKDKLIGIDMLTGAADFDIEQILMMLFDTKCIKNKSEEEFYNTPLAHLHMLGSMMMVYIQTGKLDLEKFYSALDDSMKDFSIEEESEEVPL